MPPKKPTAKPPQPDPPAANPENAPRQRRHYLPAEERRRHILESARGVFSRSGLKGARTRELAQAAGINQATLFEHFRSKEDLFMAAVVQPLTAQLEGSRERAQTYAAADSRESLVNLLQDRMKSNLESMVEVYPLLVQALFADQELGRTLYHEQILPLLSARAELMGHLTRPGLDPELLQLASFGIFLAVAMDRAMTGRQTDLADVAHQLADLIINGSAGQGTQEGQP